MARRRQREGSIHVPVHCQLPSLLLLCRIFFSFLHPVAAAFTFFFLVRARLRGVSRRNFGVLRKISLQEKKYEKKKTSPLYRHAFHLISLVVYLFSSRHSHLTAACSGRRILPAGIVDPRDSRYVLESIHLCVCMCV